MNSYVDSIENVYRHVVGVSVFKKEEIEEGEKTFPKGIGVKSSFLTYIAR
jgi:hypothetical protein